MFMPRERIMEEEMEKYGVQIDPDKVPKEKKAGVGDGVPHPNSNVPLDPNKGTEPYERKPDAQEKKD
jgi:hypothetical protein